MNWTWWTEIYADAGLLVDRFNQQKCWWFLDATTVSLVLGRHSYIQKETSRRREGLASTDKLIIIRVPWNEQVREMETVTCKDRSQDSEEQRHVEAGEEWGSSSCCHWPLFQDDDYPDFYLSFELLLQLLLAETDNHRFCCTGQYIYKLQICCCSWVQTNVWCSLTY